MAGLLIFTPRAKKLTLAAPTVPDEVLVQHAALAHKLGVAVAAPVNTPKTNELANFLIEQDIRVYNLKAVYDYMDAKARGRGLSMNTDRWHWFPLRGQDLPARNDPLFNEGQKRSRFQWSRSLGTLTTDIYRHAVPLPVLLTAERIVDAMGDKVQFYVGAIDDRPAADPFLAVRMRGDAQLFVVERWDEPSFRDR